MAANSFLQNGETYSSEGSLCVNKTVFSTSNIPRHPSCHVGTIPNFHSVLCNPGSTRPVKIETCSAGLARAILEQPGSGRSSSFWGRNLDSQRLDCQTNLRADVWGCRFLAVQTKLLNGSCWLQLNYRVFTPTLYGWGFVTRHESAWDSWARWSREHRSR